MLVVGDTTKQMNHGRSCDIQIWWTQGWNIALRLQFIGSSYLNVSLTAVRHLYNVALTSMCHLYSDSSVNRVENVTLELCPRATFQPRFCHIWMSHSLPSPVWPCGVLCVCVCEQQVSPVWLCGVLCVCVCVRAARLGVVRPVSTRAETRHSWLRKNVNLWRRMLRLLLTSSWLQHTETWMGTGGGALYQGTLLGATGQAACFLIVSKSSSAAGLVSERWQFLLPPKNPHPVNDRQINHPKLPCI